MHQRARVGVLCFLHVVSRVRHELCACTATTAAPQRMSLTLFNQPLEALA